MACANGHAGVVRTLLERGAVQTPNDAGNLPAHWAAQNNELDCMRALIAGCEGLDVLARNGYGKGVLTVAIAGGHAEMAELLLTHPSASEEKLLASTRRKEVEEAKDTEASGAANGAAAGNGAAAAASSSSSNGGEQDQEAEVTHAFNFGAGDVLIREKVMVHENEHAFGERSEEDRTGLGVWSAALLLARWLTMKRRSFDRAGEFVVELGAGCGVSGVALGVAAPAARVWITDLNPVTMENARHNVGLNFEADADAERVRGVVLDWRDRATWPAERPTAVIGADLVYTAEIVPMLVSTVSGLLPDVGSAFYYCAPTTGRHGLPEFLQAMGDAGFKIAEMTEVGHDDLSPFRQNPLKSGDDELFFLYFQDMHSFAYLLYKFERERPSS
uniref:Calmodulin-lysine N-methyltransferase n=2 Tax=Phaeomonas parva TaxID=124430 RepID=A0A7S1UE24_9STRA|mmetsp:Transcript_40708/g.127346  ORF Transcript_40708/g.127346 Transcript_40708/m.127346 type:complete len:388 (+) Transcript_40708:163-1326(+)